MFLLFFVFECGVPSLILRSRCIRSVVTAPTSWAVFSHAAAWDFVCFFTPKIRRHHRIDPRLAFRLESSTFSMEDDSRRLLRRTPWQRLLVW